MGIIILRILYTIWAVGIIFFCIHGISVWVFVHMSLRRQIKFLFTMLCFAVVWPLALFSPKGRKILLAKIEHF